MKGREEMTEKRMKVIGEVWGRIDQLRGRIARGPHAGWYEFMPEDMRARHMQEALAWWEAELAQLEAEFEGL